MAGRGTLDFLLRAAERLLEAELAVAAGDDEQLAAYERYWEITWAMAVVNKSRYEAGRSNIQDYMESTYARLR